ncbi:MAG: hypothetical protein K2X93_24170 [Candidatus Obscuribacterales bacterium]|nr:hypothetical protein [Candidatus Obscuribacterales bacterium]
MKIQLIEVLAELDGGEFLEIFPGPYKGRSWNEQSVYVEDRAFSLIEPIVKRHVPTFDHRANSAITRESWMLIINDLTSMKEALANAQSLDGVVPNLRVDGIKTAFEADFQNNVARLTGMIEKLTVWLNRELESQPVISVLGI